MNRNLKLLTGTLLSVVVLSGCNIGMSPAGASTEEYQKDKQSWPPEKQIRFIEGSPMTPAQKQQKIAEIEKKYGIKANAPADGGPPVPGAAGANP